MTSNQLLNLPRLQEIGNLAEEISDKCTELQDQLAEYENTYDLPKPEQFDARESVREAVIGLLAEITSDLRELEKLHDRFSTEPVPDPASTQATSSPQG